MRLALGFGGLLSIPSLAVAATTVPPDTRVPTVETLFDLVFTALPLALVALASVYLSRPLINSTTSRRVSKGTILVLLFLAFMLSKGLKEENGDGDPSSTAIWLSVVYFLFKSVAIYIISCYARSVGKSPYWGFIGILNFVIVFALLITGLWKTKKAAPPAEQEGLTGEQRIDGLRRMIDNPRTTAEKREWAKERLSLIERMES